MEVQCCATSGGDQYDCGSDRRDACAPPVATHSRRRIVRLRDWLGWPRIIKSDSEDPHWPCDVLELPFAFILEGDIELAPNLPVRVIGDANATGLRQSLQTRCHIHAIAENVTSIDDDVADINANPELDALLIWYLGIALGHPALDIKSAAHCVHTTLLNSASSPSPVFLTTRPRCSAILGSTRVRRWSWSWTCVPSSSRPVNRL